MPSSGTLYQCVYTFENLIQGLSRVKLIQGSSKEGDIVYSLPAFLRAFFLPLRAAVRILALRSLNLSKSVRLARTSFCWRRLDQMDFSALLGNLVDHVHDGCDLALLGSVGQEGNAANLDKLLERHSSLLVEVNQAMLAWSFPHCSLLCVYQNCICCLFNYFYERYIDKDSTSNFSLDHLINILEFYFRTIYFGFETSRHQVHKASWTRDVLFLCIKWYMRWHFKSVGVIPLFRT